MKKALLKNSIAIVTSVCITFIGMDSSFLTYAEENQTQCIYYDAGETENNEFTENNEEVEESSESIDESEQKEEYTETVEENNTEETESIEENKENEIESTEKEAETESEQLEQTEITESENETTSVSGNIPEEAEAESNQLVQTELTEAVNGTTISVSGNLPEDIELVVTELEDSKVVRNSIEEELNGVATITVYKSFDISLILEGEEYEPESDNSNVTVTIQCEDKVEDNLTVFHTDDNNNTTEIESTIDTENKTVEFITESFSIYTIASVTYDTDTGVEYSNEYGTGYYFADTKTLLVTAGTTTNTNELPWYEQKDNIEKVIITSNVTNVKDYTFYDYKNIKSVIIEEGVKSIGSYTFKGCSSLTEVILPSGLNSIGSNAFMGCSTLNHIVVPDSCTSFSVDGVFSECTSLTSASPISSNKGTGYEYGWTDKIPSYAFYKLSNLSEIEFLDSITLIEQYALDGCSSLTEVVLPTELKTVGFKSFQNCDNLTKITAYENISSIETNEFYVSSLTDTTVITDNTIVKNYNWSDDNRNVTFQRLTPVTDLDICIPVNNMSFDINSDKNFISEAVNIVNNSPCDIDVYITNITGESNAVDIVSSQSYTDDEWNSMTEFNNIAFMINGKDLATAYNNSAKNEDKYINLGYIKSTEAEIIESGQCTYNTYDTSTANVGGEVSISSGKAGYVGNGSANYISWTIDVENTGSYYIGVTGAVNGTRTTYISANDVNVGSVTHTGTSWSNEYTVYTKVNLQAGENVIKLYNDSEYAPDIYNIQLSNEYGELAGEKSFKLQLGAKYPRNFELDTDLTIDYNLTFLFVSQE